MDALIKKTGGEYTKITFQSYTPQYRVGNYMIISVPVGTRYQLTGDTSEKTTTTNYIQALVPVTGYIKLKSGTI